MHKSVSYNINAVRGKISKRCLLFEKYILYKNRGIQTDVKKAKRRRNQRHTPLDFAISSIGQFIF